MLDRSSRKPDNKSSRAWIERTIRRSCELNVVDNVQIIKSLMDSRLQSHVFVKVVVPIALHRTAIVVLVVPDLSLATRSHDRSNEVDSVLLFCHKLLSSNDVAKVSCVSLKHFELIALKSKSLEGS